MFPRGDRGDGSPIDIALLNILAPVIGAHGLLIHGTKKASLVSNQVDQNLIPCLYPGVIMGGTTLGRKHNVGKRAPTECVDHDCFTGSRHRWNLKASSYAYHSDRHSTVGRDLA
ncbi:hypothetical protein PoB_003747400 [Plakobranchus ocellatus]|uniref:Uncharacterized protein n=1 Tax=Plakobranchus ocellatus TaxID=259542 RepID=A0AAV4AT31_9GAST|nr:hypothetical protein PoB_003747400 [Plakobranchus ocellatus]